MKDFLAKIWKTIRIILLILLLLGIGVIAFFTFGNYSEGYRAGTIIKFSKKGYVFKTYEGTLNLGLVITDNSAANFGSNLFDFSVQGSEEQMIKDLEKYILSGQRVKLFYKQKYIKFPWVGDTKYLITSIEVLEGKAPVPVNPEPNVIETP